jgi:hypothetical protein
VANQQHSVDITLNIKAKMLRAQKIVDEAKKLNAAIGSATLKAATSQVEKSLANTHRLLTTATTDVKALKIAYKDLASSTNTLRSLNASMKQLSGHSAAATSNLKQFLRIAVAAGSGSSGRLLTAVRNVGIGAAANLLSGGLAPLTSAIPTRATTAAVGGAAGRAAAARGALGAVAARGGGAAMAGSMAGAAVGSAGGGAGGGLLAGAAGAAGAAVGGSALLLAVGGLVKTVTAFRDAMADADRVVELNKQLTGLRALSAPGPAGLYGRQLLPGMTGETALSQLRGAGEGLGLPYTDAFAVAQRAALVGGGAMGDQRVTRAQITAMEALQGFGVDPATTGQFLFAERRGGLVGRHGDATSDVMVDAITNAMQAGLEGSEITDYLQQIASGIADFKHSGIPFNDRALATLSQGLAMSVGGVRGARIAGSVVGAARQTALEGPQNFGDILMLQRLGGLNTSGPISADDLLAAEMRLEEGDFGPEQIRGLMSDISRSFGRGAAGVRATRRFFGKRGIGMSLKETQRLLGADERLTDEDTRLFEQFAGEIVEGTRRASAFLGGRGEIGTPLGRRADETVDVTLKRDAAHVGNVVVDLAARTAEQAQKFRAASKSVDEFILKTEILHKAFSNLAGIADYLSSKLRERGGVELK